MRIMLVDDDQGSRDTVKTFLHMLGHEIEEFSDAIKALKVLPIANISLILADIKMPRMSGIEFLKAIRQLPFDPKPPVVLFTGYGTMESAIEALRAGAFDYLLKPVNAETLAMVIDRVESQLNLHSKIEPGVNIVSFDSQQIAIYSPEMEDIVRQALVFHHHREVSVLIEGETGTGKELIARLIHHGQKDEKKPFVDINCAAISPNLFESELFGYEAGAFTGGKANGWQGKVDLAQGGTLFLDEIAEIPLELQSKLLRFIQEKEFYRISGLKKNKADIRIISATNQDLETQVLTGRFRKDLFYRLKVGQIIIPPLRHRHEEIVPLADLFLQEASRRLGKHFTAISPAVKLMLAQYDWPGNVRELANLIEFVVMMYDENTINDYHIAASLDKRNKTAIARPLLPKQNFASKRVSTDAIISALKAAKGNRSQAAKLLGVSRRTLYRLFDEHNIKQ